MTQYGIFFDQSRCYACQACSVACKDWNGLEPGPEKWMTVYEWEKGYYPDLRIHNLAFSCGHCENPVCAEACSNNAIFKEDKYGAVLVDQEKCQGCRQCFDACPYGAPKFADDAPGTKMSKCTMCIDRLEQGEKPICVLSCPLRAFDFGPVDKLAEKYGDLRQLDEMPDPGITRPAYLLKPNPPKKQLIPYDSVKAVALSQKRGNIGTLFESIEDVSNIKEGTVKRNKLQMKHTTNMELMRVTRNDIG